MKKVLLVLMILIFTSCNRTQETNDINDSDVPTTTEATEPPREHREIIVAGWWQSFMDSTEEVPTPDDPGDYVTRSLQWNHLNNVVMPELNISFTYLQLPGFEILGLVTASVIAGAPIADMVMMPTFDVFNAALGGILQPLEDFVPAEHRIFSDQPGVIRPVFTFFDKTWTFLANHPTTHGYGLLVNLDMVNRYGLDNPVELYERGEWTWDNFRRLMQEATFSSTGTTIDYAGLGGDIAGMFAGMIPSNSGWMVNPNNLDLELDSPQTIMALEFLYDILVTDQTYARNHGDDDFPLERTLFRPFEAWQVGDVEFDFDFLPFPMGPMNTTGATNFYTPTTAFNIPVGVEDPFFVFSAYEAFLGWCDGDLELLGSSVYQNVRATFPTEASVQRLIQMMRFPSQVFDPAIVMPHGFFYDTVNNMRNGFMDRTLTPASAIESFRPPLQNIINEVIEGIRT